MNEDAATSDSQLQRATRPGRTGLALSGGGYRAMLFHAGAIWRLNELGWLPEIDRISSVSGGSIAAGRLAAHWDKLDFDPASGIARNLYKEFVQPLEKLAGWPRPLALDVWATAIGLLPFIGPGDVTAAAYRRFVTGNKTLQDLPKTPTFVFNASHFATATDWRMSRPYMGSYRLGEIRKPAFSLAKAVAASSAFPPFLSPVVIRTDPKDYHKTRISDLFDRTDLKQVVALTDGGVYDNLGMQPLSGKAAQSFSTILISDASGGLSIKGGSYWFAGSQVMRALDTATTQARGLRRSMALDWVNADPSRRKLAMWRTLTDVAYYDDPRRKRSPFDVHEDWPFFMAKIRTRLNHFSEEERARLINWGYVTCDVLMRNYVDKTALQPAALPYPHYNFEKPPGVHSDDIAAAPGELDGRTDIEPD